MGQPHYGAEGIAVHYSFKLQTEPPSKHNTEHCAVMPELQGRWHLHGVCQPHAGPSPDGGEGVIRLSDFVLYMRGEGKPELR